MKLHRQGDIFEIEILHFADGDTVFARIDCHHCGTSRKCYIRLKDIESYELNSIDKEKALVVKHKADKLWQGTKAKLLPTQTSSDKYGRIVGTITINDNTLQELLVTEGLAWYKTK